MFSTKQQNAVDNKLYYYFLNVMDVNDTISVIINKILNTRCE